MTHHLVGMAEIAEMLGVTRQRVSQLIETYEDFPKPEVELSGGRVWSRTAIETWIASHPERGPGRPEAEGRKPRFFGRASGGLFSRFTDRARNAVVKAQEEARLMQHNYIGTEHLLLGLTAIGEGLAFEVIEAHDITLSMVRGEVERMIGRGSEAPKGHVPFTPRAKKVLQLALREARHLDHNYIGTEHVLLAIVRETDGVGWKALEALGMKQGAMRTAVLDAMQGLAGKKQTVSAHAPAARCSFCNKPREEVATLVAGPGSIAICDACITLALDVVQDAGAGATTEREVRTDSSAEIIERLAQIEERLRKLEDPPEA